MTQEQSDPVIDGVREVRRRISAHFDNDPGAACGILHETARAPSRTADRFCEGDRAHGPVGRLTSRCSGACPPCL